MTSVVVWEKQGPSIVRKGAPGVLPPSLGSAKGRVAAISAFTTDSPAFGNRFAGDPGIGNFYFGGREDTLTWADPETAIANWESRMAPWSADPQDANQQKLGIVRVYGAGSLTTGFTGVSEMTRHYSQGRIGHISFKLPPAWGSTLAAQVAKALLFDADWDTWMNALSAQILALAPAPVWWTFHHEPEDYSTATLAANYRLFCRKIKQALVAHGVTNQAHIAGCIQSPYDFGAKGGTRDWRWWYPDWKGTSTPFSDGSASDKNTPNPVDFYLGSDPNRTVDCVGHDVYNWWTAAMYAGQEGTDANGNPLPATAAEPVTNYETFPVLWQRVKDRNDFLGLPYVIAEYGIEAYHTGTYIPAGVAGAPGDAVFGTTNNQRTLDNLSGLFDVLASDNIVGLEVYNYALTHNPWRLEYADPDRIRYRGYGLGMARTNCVRPRDVGWALTSGDVVQPNTPPAIALASTQSGTVGTPVVLNATATDADGITTRQWTQTAGVNVMGSATGATTGSLKFTPTSAGTYKFTFAATDTKSLSASASITLTVVAAPVTGTITGTYFGAEPSPAGNALSNQNQVATKFAGSVSIRQFQGTDLSAGPVHSVNVSVVQTSYRPNIASVISGALDNEIAALVQRTPVGDILTFYHESDNDGVNNANLTGQTLADRIACMNRLYDVAKATKPGVLISPTFTGYMFSPKNTSSGAAKRAAWAAVKGDLLGVDFDGVHAAPADGTYDGIDYSIHIPVVKQFLLDNKTKGWQGWTVPEFTTSRITAFDSTGSKRAAWFTKNGGALRSGGAYAVMVFDHPKDAGDTATSINTIPAGSPELTALQNLVNLNPANPA